MSSEDTTALSPLCNPIDGPVNPDIEGIGVMVSFIATTLITLGVLSAAYLSRALRPDRYKSIDLVFLNRVDQCYAELMRNLPFRSSDASTAGRNGITSAERILYDSELRSPQKKAKMIGYERVVLALSDQQLITGLAILIAIWANITKITATTFNVGAYLAWFSCTTHLATLTLLRDYFDLHRRYLSFRAGAMVLLLLLLTAAWGTSWRLLLYAILEDDSRSAACLLTLKGDDPFVLPYMVELAGTVVSLSTLLLGYGARLVELYSRESRNTGFTWVTWILYCTIRKIRGNNCGDLEQMSLLKRRRVIRRIFQQYRPHPGRRSHSGVRSFWNMIRIRATLFRAGLQDNWRSFLFELNWLYFLALFGFVRLMTFYLFYVLNVLDDFGSGRERILSQAPSFGQLMPLLLLSLPILQGAEVYSEQKRNIGSTDARSDCAGPISSDSVRSAENHHVDDRSLEVGRRASNSSNEPTTPSLAEIASQLGYSRFSKHLLVQVLCAFALLHAFATLLAYTSGSHSMYFYWYWGGPLCGLIIYGLLIEALSIHGGSWDFFTCISLIWKDAEKLQKELNREESEMLQMDHLPLAIVRSSQVAVDAMSGNTAVRRSWTT